MEDGNVLDEGALKKLVSDSSGAPPADEIKVKKKASAIKLSMNQPNVPESDTDAGNLQTLGTEHWEVTMEEEVRQAEMESRLRRMIAQVLKPSIVKVTRLQTDHEMMCDKFQEMIDSHTEVLSAQKEAKEHSEVIAVFKSKLSEFWTFSNVLEDKISSYQKKAEQRMEEIEHECERNKSNALLHGRNLDRATQDMEGFRGNIKAMQASLEKGIQKNKERMDTEIRQMHLMVGEVRDLHNKLEAEVWGPEDCSDISPPCLRKLDMQMRRQNALLTEAMDDVAALQKLDAELIAVSKRQGVAEGQIKELQAASTHLGERVEVCAQEAKADFKQASNLMAAFSANLVREARQSFKDELKHAQEMQQDVDAFVKQTQATITESDEFVKSLSRQLEATVKEVRFDLESYDQKRHRDKQGVEQQLRQLQGKVASAADTSDFMLRGLEHVSGVISMSLQSERMSVALDLQDFRERKDTPYVGVCESPVETSRLRQIRAEKGIRQPGVDVEALQRLLYRPNPIEYQGTSFERTQLLALREKLVHIAQDVLQKGPDMSRKIDTSPEHLMASLSQPVHPTITSAEQTRCSTPARPGSREARPGSRGQPGARGSVSPMLDGLDGVGMMRNQRQSPVSDDAREGTPLELKDLEEAFNPYRKASAAAAGSNEHPEGLQLPPVSALPPSIPRRPSTRSSVDSMPAPLTAR